MGVGQRLFFTQHLQLFLSVSSSVTLPMPAFILSARSAAVASAPAVRASPALDRASRVASAAGRAQVRVGEKRRECWSVVAARGGDRERYEGRRGLV